MSRPATGASIEGVLATGVDDAFLSTCADLLARQLDPEVVDAAAGVPEQLTLDELLAIDRPVDQLADEHHLRAVLGAAAPPRPSAPPTPFVVDLEADGPHLLIGGTTGSGKSELLRTLVLSLALAHPPDAVTFVLVDYKGGSAFDACADLPHTVGVVTDLDEHLGARALSSLDAEIRRRERLLRSAGAGDLAAHRRGRGPDDEPLPRLVVVVDEFATLAAELPTFLDALVGVAQRGRSLGVHLVLATQRPQGAVNDRIRANTNLRIALRMLDRADSVDVIGDPGAAAIPRRRPGRAVARLGPDELVPFQVARTSPTRLAALVGEVRQAFVASGRSRPHAPWLPPLPSVVTLDELAPLQAAQPPDVIGLALADEPTRQRQVAWAWQPSRGNLLVYGMPGSGTTTTLLTVGLALARLRAPTDCHLYGIADGTHRLAALGVLPHTGSIVAADDLPRQARLLRWLADEVDRRRADRPDLGNPAGHPSSVVTLVDDLGGLLRRFESLAGQPVVDDLTRVFRDGPAVGIHLALVGDRPAAVPAALGARSAERIVLRLPDPFDLATLGVSAPGRSGRSGPALGRRLHGDDDPDRPGRGWVGTGTEVQVATAVDPPAEARRIADRHPPVGDDRRPHPIGTLPPEVAADRLGRARAQDGALVLPIGLSDRSLDVAELVLHPGEHAVIAGPPRSGRSTTLGLLAEVARRAGPAGRSGIAVVTWRSARSARVSGAGGGGASISVSSGRALLGALADQATAEIILLLVDDAERVEDPTEVLATLARSPGPRLHLVVAGRADRLRTAYGHWTTALRPVRHGVALRPDHQIDGDLWDVRLPRSLEPAQPAGRGFLVADGRAELVQVARSIAGSGER